jgi:hypothetical protein
MQSSELHRIAEQNERNRARSRAWYAKQRRIYLEEPEPCEPPVWLAYGIFIAGLAVFFTGVWML